MLRLQARAEPSRWWVYASPVLALLVTVVLGVALFLLLGKDPVRGLAVFSGSLCAAATPWVSWW